MVKSIKKKYGLKLAYCHYDFRQLSDYCEQLQQGLYLVGIFRGYDTEICDGTTNRHMIVIKDGKIYDSVYNNTPCILKDSIYEYNFVIQILRVVPDSYLHEI